MYNSHLTLIRYYNIHLRNNIFLELSLYNLNHNQQY